MTALLVAIAVVLLLREYLPKIFHAIGMTVSFVFVWFIAIVISALIALPIVLLTEERALTLPWP